MSETVQVRLPKLGMSMTEGNLTEWLVADGDRVQEGEALYTIATDKVEQDVESPATGTVRLIAEPDADYEVGALLAEIIAE